MGAKMLGTAVSSWRTHIVAAALMIILCCAAAADTAITGVDVKSSSDRIVISVQADGALNMGVIKSSAGRYLAFQFACRMTAPGRLVGVHSGRLSNVRYSNFSPSPPATRIVINTSCHVDYTTEWSADRKHVDITVPKFARTLAAKPARPIRQANATPLVNKDFIPVEPQPATRKASASAEVEQQNKMVAPPVTAVPITLAPTPCLPTVSHSKPIAPAHSMPVPAEPAVTLNPAPAASVQTRVAPSIEHMAKASGSGNSDPFISSPAVKPERGIGSGPSGTAGPAVSLNFLGADIHDVLKALSTQSGKNIVAGKDVSGNITVSLANIGLDEALEYVTKLSGYNYSKENDTYLVGSKDSLKAIHTGAPVGPSVEVVQVKYTKIKDLGELIKNQFPDVKSTNGDTGSSGDKDSKATGGVIVLSGPAETVGAAKHLVEQVDASMGGLVSEAYTDVYQVKYVSTMELKTALESLYADIRITPAPSGGFNLTSPASTASGAGASASSGGAAAPAPGAAESRSQALVISGSEPAVKRAMTTAAKLDTKSPQIKVEAKVTSVNESGEKKLGLSWNWGDFGMSEGFTDFNKTTGSPDDKGNTQNVRRAHGLWSRQPFNFAATLDAIIKNGDGKLLAAPTLMCLEGKPGKFFVGDEVRYVTLVQVTPTGTNVTTETANVGIQLCVIGDVSPDGYITLSLHPEVSILQLVADKQAGITLPTITRRYTDHVVRVKNGETLVIGGLISDKEINDMEKVPILGDLPVLKNLFRHKSTTKEHSEVVIFVTASVIEE